MSTVDSELERLMEALTSARARLDTREPLIREALDELPHSESIRLENYLGFGRSLRLNDAVRVALTEAAEEELTDLRKEVEEARERVLARQMALAGV